MNNNPLVKEVRRKRAEILASYGGDFHAMMRDMMRHQWDSGHPVVNLATNAAPRTQPSRPAPTRGKR